MFFENNFKVGYQGHQPSSPKKSGGVWGLGISKNETALRSRV
jgi:hypothetical protein